MQLLDVHGSFLRSGHYVATMCDLCMMTEDPKGSGRGAARLSGPDLAIEHSGDHVFMQLFAKILVLCTYILKTMNMNIFWICMYIYIYIHVHLCIDLKFL